MRSGMAQVVVAAEPVDALDPDDAVGLDADDRAHLLQHGDQVEDLGLDGGVAQLGDALGADGGQQHLLGGADARVRQRRSWRPCRPSGRGEAQAVGALLDDRRRTGAARRGGS